jgi:hypothetical protein
MNYVYVYVYLFSYLAVTDVLTSSVTVIGTYQMRTLVTSCHMGLNNIIIESSISQSSPGAFRAILRLSFKRVYQDFKRVQTCLYRITMFANEKRPPSSQSTLRAYFLSDTITLQTSP